MFDSIDQGPKKSKNKLLICLFNIRKMQLCQDILWKNCLLQFIQNWNYLK